MKIPNITTRRKPTQKTIYARLFPSSKIKKQRAAAMHAPVDMEESGINISRSLSIIFAVHILAIGAIFFHKHYLAERTATPAKENKSAEQAAEATPNATSPSTFSDGSIPHLVDRGENFMLIAEKYGIEESELRNANRGKEIRPGAILSIPQSKRIVAAKAPEPIVEPQANLSEQGLVEILPPPDAQEARLVRPLAEANGATIPKATPVTSTRTHTVQAGENVWRISNKYKVSQQELLALNQISDPSKLKIGQVLKLP
jgi:LysM repeat protein